MRYLCKDKQDIKILNHFYKCNISHPYGYTDHYFYIFIFVEDNKTSYKYCTFECNLCSIVVCSTRDETLLNIKNLLRDQKLKRILE